MAFTAHNPGPFYTAIAARLATSTGKNIGRTRAPANVTTPYAVVYTLDENDVDASLGDPTDVTLFNWQVTSVGDSEEQALWMMHKCRVALLGWQPVVSGITCGFVLRDGGQGVRPDEGASPTKFFGADQFTVLVD